MIINTIGEPPSPHNWNDGINENHRNYGTALVEEVTKVEIPPATGVIVAAAGATAPPQGTAVETLAKRARRPRGANPKRDNVWTRHHAISLMGLIGDSMMGGSEAARSVAEPLKQFPRLTKDIPRVLLDLCPWIIEQPKYLNLQGSVGLAALGLPRCYQRWAANRVYYFYRTLKHPEHPATRVRANIRLVYPLFCQEFGPYVADARLISMQRANEFWLGVTHCVPFYSPDLEGECDCHCAPESVPQPPEEVGIP